MTAALSLKGISKWFGDVKAVDRLSLEIEEGSVFTLLGPSGCGKTTTLRMMAGLEWPDEGEIVLKNRTIVSVERRIFVNPEKRNMGMVFQSYAIWPHMTVFKNVAYPLQLRRHSHSEIRKRVLKALELVGLGGLEDRPAPNLSGGQQQRVAIARALVYEPEVLLLDEPLSNLDAKLREQMRLDLKLLQLRLGITVVYVTHDQLEALSLSDEIVVMNHGQVEQYGSARELYDEASTPFVRDFVGKTVLLKGRLRTIKETEMEVEISDLPGAVVHCPNAGMRGLSVGQNVFLSVRPEDVEVGDDLDGGQGNLLPGVVETALFVGERSECQIRVGQQSILLYLPRHQVVRPRQTVSVHLPRQAVRLWPA